MIVTIFKDLSKTNTPFYRSIDIILDRIKTGTSKELIAAISAESDKKKRNELKAKLPAICFSGTFSKRNDNSLLEHSGLICLDFDNYTNAVEFAADVEKYRADKYTFSLFISPSANGFKMLVKIPPDADNHKNYFDALAEYYDNTHFDVTSKNVSRICFESYDENIYINKNSLS